MKNYQKTTVSIAEHPLNTMRQDICYIFAKAVLIHILNHVLKYLTMNRLMNIKNSVELITKGIANEYEKKSGWCLF